MIKVTAESFCKNPVLCGELLAQFPQAVFWDRKSTSLPEFCADAEALIIGREPINEALLQACPSLKIIAKYGVGLDNVDQAACERHGVQLGWTPGVNNTSVAELVLAFMLASTHNVFRTGMQLKQGNWLKQGGTLLSGKTVGIIGVGHVGKEIIRLLQPFSCRILVNDIVNQEEYYLSNNLIESSRNDLFSQSDILSINVPLTDETYHLVRTESFALMKEHAILINTSRGEVIKQGDLLQALRNGKLGAVHLDVFEEEPCFDSELLQHEKVFCTPHIGGNAWEAVLAMGRSAISHISYFYKNQ